MEDNDDDLPMTAQEQRLAALSMAIEVLDGNGTPEEALRIAGLFYNWVATGVHPTGDDSADFARASATN